MTLKRALGEVGISWNVSFTQRLGRGKKSRLRNGRKRKERRGKRRDGRPYCYLTTNTSDTHSKK